LTSGLLHQVPEFLGEEPASPEHPRLHRPGRHAEEKRALRAMAKERGTSVKKLRKSLAGTEEEMQLLGLGMPQR
jgi:hypothetical protein